MDGLIIEGYANWRRTNNITGADFIKEGDTVQIVPNSPYQIRDGWDIAENLGYVGVKKGDYFALIPQEFVEEQGDGDS